MASYQPGASLIFVQKGIVRGALNYKLLPARPLKPEIFHDKEELKKLIDKVPVGGSKPIIFLSGREGVGMLDWGGAAFENVGGNCERQDFFKASVAVCRR